MRILIIGHPGSGKTYLADKLSNKLDIEKIDIDVLYDKNPLYLLSKGLYRKALDRLIDNKKQWVIDGYHAGRMPEGLLGDADTILFLNLPKTELKENVLRRYRTKKANKEFSHWQSTRINNIKNFCQIRFEDRALRSEIRKAKTLMNNNALFVELHSREEVEKLLANQWLNRLGQYSENPSSYHGVSTLDREFSRFRSSD